MGIKEAVIFLLLICIQSISCVPVEIDDDPFCDNYHELVSYDIGCRPDGFFKMRHLSRMIEVSRDDALSDVRATCSNETNKEAYNNCMNLLSLKCPVQYVEVDEFLRNKMNMFCDGSDVSDWIQKVVHDGFSNKRTCLMVTDDVLTNCVEELNIENRVPGSNVSFAMALELFPSIITEMFHCMKTKFTLTPTPSDGCVSSWQDILIHYWTDLMFTSSFFSLLSVQDAQELLAIAESVSGGEILNI
ncbi:uncharacterized protein LOC132755975 [Ruditapes philippinarum]|uniref:uncharacterized protein LOC132755975 n=1 Tax=Ruditapes philippinarum TaxID=129788 RepID=UPI00295BD307|nr:uncharacterized protein LOC132755975 [Ruditapes philippinarum]